MDAAKVEAFAGHMMGMFTQGMLSVLVSIGHKTRLFDAMAGLPPSSSDAIAQQAGLSERYVREWLGAMVTARIVDYDGARRTYALPPEHAASLARGAGPMNVAVFTQLVGESGALEPRLAACFASGEGLPYSAYRDFHVLQHELTAGTFDGALIGGVLPLLPGVVDRLRAGADVLDLGCGAGRAIQVLAAAFPASRFVGLDLGADAVALARDGAAARDLQNARFEAKDAADLDAVAAYDLITAFDVVHDLGKPAEVLARIRRALRPGGTFLCVDIGVSSNLADNVGHPMAPAVYAMSVVHCLAVSLGQGGPGLGAAWGEELARRMLAEAGFTDVSVQRVPGDPLNAYYVCRA